MALEQLACKNCGKPLTAEQVNLQTGLASCAACNAVFNIAGQKIPPPPPPPRPDRVKTTEFGPAKEWHWKWWSTSYAVLLVLAILFNGFILFWYGLTLGKILEGEDGGWIMAAIGLILLSTGVFLGYVVLAGIRNITTIRHAPGILEIVHHPYSRFFGGGRWDTGTFASLHFETIRGSKSSVSYRLTAKQTNGESVKLVAEDRDTTRFLAHELAVAMKLPLDESA